MRKKVFAFIILLAVMGISAGCALKEKGYARIPDSNTLTSINKVYAGEPPSLAVSGGFSAGDKAVMESIGKMSEAQKEQTDILRQIASALKGEKEPVQEGAKKPEPGAFSRKKEITLAPEAAENTFEIRLHAVERKIEQKADTAYVDQKVTEVKAANQAAIARLRAAINGGGSNCQTEKRIGQLEDRAGQDAKHYASWLSGFEKGKSELTEKQKTKLDSLAATIRAENIKITRIEGYSDTQGPEQANKNLSLHRAESVKSYLLGKGLDTKGVEIIAGGETDSYGSKCRKNNRVVTIFGERIPSPAPKPAPLKKK
jgi:outer membrane protein OmpA-like peptidoglycan-associated protein